MKKILLAVCLLFVGSNLVAQNATYQWKTATAGGYTYKYVTNDPSKTRFYTLKNGLTVILSPNYKEPKIEYRMSVRAGSNTDPKNATGLAHYLEHLLFKGTDKFGTANWAKEKPLLDKIDALYEKYNKTTDPAQRKEIYKEIEKLKTELVGEDELETVRNYMIGNFLSNFSSAFDLIGRFKSIHQAGLDQSFYVEKLDFIRKFTAQDILEVGQKYFNKSDMVEVIVG